MMFGSGLLRNEVTTWRLLGAATWCLISIAVAASAWELAAAPASLLAPWALARGALRPSAWWRLIRLGVSQGLAFAAHSAVVTTVEAAPACGTRLLGAPASPASLLASKALGRVASAGGLLAWAAYLVAHAASALLTLLLDAQTRATLAGERPQCFTEQAVCMRVCTMAAGVSSMCSPSAWLEHACRGVLLSMVVLLAAPAGTRWLLVLSASTALVHAAHVMYW